MIERARMAKRLFKTAQDRQEPDLPLLDLRALDLDTRDGAQLRTVEAIQMNHSKRGFDERPGKERI